MTVQMQEMSQRTRCMLPKTEHLKFIYIHVVINIEVVNTN